MRLADEGDQLRRPISCPQISAFDAGAIGVSPQVTVAAVALGVVVDCQRGGGARDRVAGAFEQLGHFAGILKRRVQVLLVKNEKEHAWAINSRNID